MKPFEFTRATTMAQALHLINEGAVALAGGTNLVDHLRLGVRSADLLVDINRLTDTDGSPLDQITQTPDGGLRIGALVRNSDLAANPLVRRNFPFVTQAVVAGASGQIRNMASTAGNLMQRTRCVYFQDLNTPCNKREPGSGCSAIEGFGRYNALIGASEQCVAVHPSDLCVPLAALDAVVVAEGLTGPRRIPFAEFFRLPGEEPERDNTLAQGELITAVEIAPLPFAVTSHYRKVRERASYAFALVSVAAALDLSDDGVIRDVRLALGGVSHRPHRALAAEERLRGRPALREEFLAAADAELAAARAGRDNAFKIPQLRNTIAVVLGDLADRGGASGSVEMTDREDPQGSRA